MHKLVNDHVARQWALQARRDVFYRLTDGRNAVCYLVSGELEPIPDVQRALAEHVLSALLLTGSVTITETH